MPPRIQALPATPIKPNIDCSIKSADFISRASSSLIDVVEEYLAKDISV
jgi:hypothetical protein